MEDEGAPRAPAGLRKEVWSGWTLAPPLGLESNAARYALAVNLETALDVSVLELWNSRSSFRSV